MRSYITALVFVFACFAATPSLAQATPDFVFNVPVRIENAPPLSGRAVRVQCNLRAYSPAGVWIAGPSGGQYVDVGPTGGYRGTVRVEVTLPPTVPRSAVRDWFCELVVAVVTGPSGEAVSISGGTRETVLARYTSTTGQAIASHSMSASGTFPP
jgi:hypothetical protein